MRIYICFLFLMFLFSCYQKESDEIKSIRVLYYNGLFESIIVVNCDEIVYKPIAVSDTCVEYTEDGFKVPKEAVILDTTITSKEILQEITTELHKREVINEDYMDARMKCYILFESGQIDSLCVDDIPIYGNYNNQPVKLTNRFAYLIRKNCGFYRWIGADYLKYFGELNDSSFVRDKVTSITGKKY